MTHWEIAVELDVVTASVVDEDPISASCADDGAEHRFELVVLARESGGVGRPEPQVHRHRSATSVLACDSHASVVAEIVADDAFAPVPDLREEIHLRRIGLLYVGRVDDDERVGPDAAGDFLRDELMKRLRNPLVVQMHAESVTGLFHCDRRTTGPADFRELHVAPGHEPVEHVAEKPGLGL